MSRTDGCTKAELQERLKRFPAEVDFTDLSEKSFVSWVNGHCFLWTENDGKWDCEEL